MPTGFHPNPHFFSAHLELTVELLRFLAVPQFPLVPFTTVRIDKRNLLEARVIVTTYNDHVGSFLPSLGWLAPPKFTRAWEPTLLWNHYTHDRVLSVIAFHEKAGRSQVVSLSFLFVTRFFSAELPTVATLPSALFDERVFSLGARWVFSF